jgi:PAS domain S-box-containing protein
VRAFFDDNQKPIEYQGVGRDNTEKREAATRINQYVRDMEFLSRKAQEFVELSSEADIFKIIGQGLSELLPSAVIILDSYDQLSEILSVRTVFSDKDRQILSTCIGQKCEGFQISLRTVPAPLKTFALNILQEGKLFHTDESLYTFLFQQVPVDICNRIQDTLNLGDRYYGIGLVRHGILFGIVIFLLRKGETIPDSSLIETFIRQASIVLHRRQTDDALKASESRYRSVLENIQDVFYRSDTKGNLIMTSPSWARMLGYDSLEDCIGFNIAEKFYFEPQLRKKFLDAVYRNGSVIDYEVTLKCRDGSPLYVSTNSHLYYDEKGELLGVEGIFRDISERHAAAEKIQLQINTLRESEEIFSSVAKYAPVPIAIIEPDGTYRYINQKFIETFGYDLNDFKTGREWFSLAYPDPLYRKKVIDAWKSDLKAYKSGTERPEIFTVRCKNGVDREIVFRPVTLSDKKQCIVYEDLTNQYKEHYQLLKNAKTGCIPGTDQDISIPEAVYPAFPDHDTSKIPGLLSPHYLSLALKMARDYIAILDRSGKCVWVNDALVSAVNAGSCNDLAGKSIALYIAPEFRKMALDSLMEVKKSGNKTVPLMMLSSSGRVPVEANISAITTEEGDLFGYMAIARHVEREKVEKSR